MEGHNTAGSKSDGSSGFHSVFHGGHNELLFFTDLRTSSAQQFLGACVVVFMLALVNEGLRLLVSWLHHQGNSSQQQLPLQPSRSEQSVCVQGLSHTVSYILHLFVHYCLMLIFMTLNVWLCLSLLLGAGLGFLLFHFRPVRSRIFRFLGVREHCPQQKEDKDTYSEMTDVTPETTEEFRWNSASKGK